MGGSTDGLREAWLAPRLGASGKKIWVAFRGLLFGWAVFAVFGYAAHMMMGTSPDLLWARARFFPPAPESAGTADAVWSFGLVFWLVLVLVAASGIAKITYRELKGDDFYGASDAWRYALEHSRSTIGTPIALAALVVVCLLLLVPGGLLGRIPTVGPVIVGLLALPGLLIGVLGAFFTVALVLSLLYGPAVIGTTGEDALEGGVQTLGLLWDQPWRTAGSTLVSAISTLLATWLLALLTVLGLALTAQVVHAVMGAAYTRFAAGALTYLPAAVPGPADLPAALVGVPLEGLFPPAAPAGMADGSGGVAGLLGGIALLCLLALVVSFTLSSLVAGHTAAYIALRRRRDGEDLLDWPDEVDELEEHITPAAPSDTSQTPAPPVDAPPPEGEQTAPPGDEPAAGSGH
jgi:hypothetical protein